MLAVEVRGQRGGDADDKFRFLVGRLDAFLAVPRAFLGRVPPQRAERRFHGSGKVVGIFLDVFAERHALAGDVVQQAFHRPRGMADRTAEIRLRTQGEVPNCAFDPLRSRSPATGFQFGFSGPHDAFESVVPARDHLAAGHLPADAGILKIIVQLLLKGVRLRFFVWCAEFGIVKIQLVKDIL